MASPDRCGVEPARTGVHSLRHAATAAASHTDGFGSTIRRVSVFDDLPKAPLPRARLPVAAGVILAVLVVIAGAWVLLRREPAAPPASARPSAPPVTAAPPETPAAPAAATVPARRSGPKGKAPSVEAPPPAAGPVLKVDSDVPGATVFVDRVDSGTTPLTTSQVTPGSHVVTVFAQGYGSQTNTVDVTGATTDVMVRFKVVRLNEAIPVIHKHTIGSCEGRLVADLHGLRYETQNKDHAFTIPFAELKSFEVDYLQKNLRVTRKDGKTFNFTDRNPNADALFVFHKNVQAARAKLAAGLTPAEKRP